MEGKKGTLEYSLRLNWHKFRSTRPWISF